ncbi:hypothetical protein MMC26_007270 [Xylographa opegraphella]|nr:hypothetical protein [Xylographa opegraphella]
MAYFNQHALYEPANHARPSIPAQQHHQQPQHLPQHQHLNLSHAAFQHPLAHQQQLSYGGEGAMAAMPPPSTTAPSMTGGTMQMAMPSRQPPSAYQQPPLSNDPPTSSAYIASQADYSTPQSAQTYYPQTAPSISSPIHRQGPTSNQSLSPARSSMASAMAPNQSHPSVQQQQQQQQYPAQMQQRPQSSMSQKPILQPPLSPASAQRETQRVTILLDINRILLQEIVQLQAAGRAGPPPQLPTAPQKPGQASPTGTEGDVEPKEDGGATAGGDGAVNAKAWVQSQEYIQCMRRLQSNLAYLAYIADRVHKPADQFPRHPAIMDAPAVPGSTLSEGGVQGLKSLYAELAQLYPEYMKALKERERSATTTPTGLSGRGQGLVGQQQQQVGVGTA